MVRSKYFYLSVFFIVLFFVMVSYVFPRDVIRVKEYPTGTNQADLNLAMDAAVAAVNDGPVGKLGSFSDLNKGFADANTMAANAGNFNSFQNYESFALFSGFSFALQVPNLFDELLDIVVHGEHQSLKQDIMDNGDPYFGVGAASTWLNAGFNINNLLKNCYINIKFGKTSLGYRDFDYSCTLIGLEGNYNYVASRSLLWGNFIKWRGISIGTGLIYYTTNISYLLNKYSRVSETSNDAEVILDPSLKMELDVTTYTIPVNFSTSIQVLYILNFSAGAGVDINLGNSKISLTSKSDVDSKVNGVSLAPENSGEVEAVSDDDGSGPSIFRLKSFYGLGLNLGPAKLEIQYGFYYKGGFSWTINMGVVF